MKNYFMRGISNLTPIKDICNICINFQKPYTREIIFEVVNALESLGFMVTWKFSKYKFENKSKISINTIRQDTADLSLSSKYYALVDDDMIFRGSSANMSKTSGEQYVDAIHYMMTHQNCGIMLMGGTLFRKIPKYSIGPVRLESEYLTSKGFIVKSIEENNNGNGFLPENSVKLVGSDEEKVLAAARLYRGLYPAKFGHTRVAHYENKNKVTTGAVMYNWNTEEVLNENNAKFIRDHYNPKFKVRDYNVIDHEIYYSKGGIDVYSPEVINNYTVNYQDKSANDLIDEIKLNYDQIYGGSY